MENSCLHVTWCASCDYYNSVHQFLPFLLFAGFGDSPSDTKKVYRELLMCVPNLQASLLMIFLTCARWGEDPVNSGWLTPSTPQWVLAVPIRPKGFKAKNRLKIRPCCYGGFKCLNVILHVYLLFFIYVIYGCVLRLTHSKHSCFVLLCFSS